MQTIFVFKLIALDTLIAYEYKNVQNHINKVFINFIVATPKHLRRIFRYKKLKVEYHFYQWFDIQPERAP